MYNRIHERSGSTRQQSSFSKQLRMQKEVILILFPSFVNGDWILKGKSRGEYWVNYYLMILAHIRQRM